jgi:hypothetical protein
LSATGCVEGKKNENPGPSTPVRPLIGHPCPIHFGGSKIIIFAWIYIVLTIFVAVFQLALIFGAPLGEYTLGGRYPGKLPTNEDGGRYPDIHPDIFRCHCYGQVRPGL